MITLRSLRYQQGGLPILQIEDLTLPTASHTLFTGVSGCGKTTLLLLLAGLLKVQQGDLIIDKMALHTASESQRDAWRAQHVGFVRQDSGLLPALTFEQNCRLVRAKAGKKWDDSLWHRLTTQLGLAGFGARLPHAMSHGQRQRGAMVRALIGQPHYVLADEPTSALDDANAKAMGELLLSLANEHKATLLIATHDKRLYDYFPQSYNVAAWHPPLLQGGAAA